MHSPTNGTRLDYPGREDVPPVTRVIEKLKDQGLQVRIRHNQRTKVTYDMSRGLHLIPRGGTTRVFVGYEDDMGGGYGIARCRKTDQYTKKIGVALALMRASGEVSRECFDRKTGKPLSKDLEEIYGDNS